MPAASSTVVDTPSYSMLFSPAASSLASPPSAVELEVHWDPSQIRSDLRMAATILSHRGLKLAARWASEQLTGLGGIDHFAANSFDPTAFQPWMLEFTQLQDRDLYAKSLLELGEYLHAAATLSKPNDDVTSMSPPLADLSQYGFYLRAYALFLAGERRKEQDFLELQRQVTGDIIQFGFLPSTWRRLDLQCHLPIKFQ